VPLTLPLLACAVAALLIFSVVWLPFGAMMVFFKLMNVLEDSMPVWALMFPVPAAVIRSQMGVVELLTGTAFFGLMFVGFLLLLAIQLAWIPLGLVLAVILLLFPTTRRDACIIVLLPTGLLAFFIGEDD
jgi:hypothetical protein